MYIFGIWWLVFLSFFFFKQKTAYEMRISDWSSDVCSSDLAELRILLRACRVDVEVTRANVLALRGQRRVGPQRLIQILLQRRIIGTRQRRQAQQDWQHKTFHARRRPAVVAGRRPRSASSMALCSRWPDDKPASSRKEIGRA